MCNIYAWRTLQTDLLDRAWPKCKEAQRFYADLRVREYYSQGGHLEIRCLSRDLLDMAQCYINLSIIEHTWENDKQSPDNRNKEPQPSAFTLFSHMNIQVSNADKNVTLPELFKSENALMALRLGPSVS